MKMVIIAYNEAIDDEVMESLISCCVDCWTKWRKVLGQGKASEPHLDSTVWPGANNVCMLVLEDEKVKLLLAQIAKLRGKLSKEGIKAFVLPVEEVSG